jgi:hypothetical protein
VQLVYFTFALFCFEKEQKLQNTILKFLLNLFQTEPTAQDVLEKQAELIRCMHEYVTRYTFIKNALEFNSIVVKIICYVTYVIDL